MGIAGVAAPGFRTRGHPAAVGAAGAMLLAGMPHAVLVVGPPGVGKSTFAEDLAAALLCVSGREARPCRSCRACRALEHGNHPDAHRLAPTGAGNMISIGGREERGVRDLVRELALMPVEGGSRVAIITGADRMTEDAQSAFLKTLEEPPAGAVLILTAADEERLLPTIRSRCVRVRLGPVSRTDVEAILVEGGLAEAPTAARLARLVAGRPGDAVALARAPEAVTIRAEIGRTLIDLAVATRTDRLRAVRDLLGRAAALQAAIAAAAVGGARADESPRQSSRPGRGTRGRSAVVEAEAPVEPAAEATPGARVPAAERRAAALALVGIWRDVARDLALVRLGRVADVRQAELIDDLEGAATSLPEGFVVDQLRRLERAGERLEGNVSPELVLDGLALGWTVLGVAGPGSPRRAR